jgi:L-asparaginase
MPRIALIQTGGTIDSIGASRLDHAWYFERNTRLGHGELVRSIPELGDVATVSEIPFPRMSSYALTVADWLALAQTIRELLHDDSYDAVVLTHGTNTIEETAYFLHLTVGSPKPVVVVGAMRPFSALGSDSSLNLLRAVQVAAAEEARNLGVLVVMNDTIFGARDVTKTATYRVEAFQAPDLGPLGYADADGRVVVYHRHVRCRTDAPAFDVSGFDHLPRVDIVTSYVGADGAFIDAAVEAGASGIVSAGTGAGRPTPAEDEALDRASARGVVVCQSTRVGSGRVSPTPTLRQNRRVASDNLQPWKARVLLSLALTRTSDPAEIQDLFETL